MGGLCCPSPKLHRSSSRLSISLARYSTSFLAPKFFAHCCAEHFARPIHGVANLPRRSAYGVTRGHDYRLAFLCVYETCCFQQSLLIAGRNGDVPRQNAIRAKGVGFDTKSIGFRLPVFDQRKRPEMSWQLATGCSEPCRVQVDEPPPVLSAVVLAKVEYFYAARS